jgi:hypothetical protein
MTKFQDGPAQGQVLMLKASPQFLRVTSAHTGRKWDGLDQPHDVPEPGEKLFAYVLAEKTGNCHINMGRGRGGFYPMQTYKFIPNQPSDAVMRDLELWEAWCLSFANGRPA